MVLAAATTDWWIVAVSAASAIVGALIGGLITYRATLRGMRHEADLSRTERLRTVRARMVEELTGPLSFAYQTSPTITGSQAFEPLGNVVRLAYSATAEDLSLAMVAELQSKTFLDKAREAMAQAVLDNKTGQYEFRPGVEERAAEALENLQDALVTLDAHLQTALRED
jgi:hypothetical protein